MTRNLLWRGAGIVGLIALALLGLLPLKDKIHLGLDLRGGMQLQIRVQTEDALRFETERDMERLRQGLMTAGLSAATTHRTADAAFEVAGLAVGDDPSLGRIARAELGDTDWQWHREAGRTVFAMADRRQSELRRRAVDQSLITIGNRIDEFGVGERLISRQGMGGDRLVIQLPGVADEERVKRLIKTTAVLELRLVDFPSGGYASRADVMAHYGVREDGSHVGGALPPGIEILEHASDAGAAPAAAYGVERRVVVSGRDLKGARPAVDELGAPTVHFTLTAEGARAFGEATSANIGRALAVVLDGRVQSVAIIHSRITDSGVIQGRFTSKQVEDLANILSSGALPAGVTVLEERTVGPSLGADAIRQGLRATTVGTVLVLTAMIAVYRGSGWNAVLALAVNLLLVLGALAYFGATLTLPGIAGLALTVGVAVDANVLVFERIKEELRAGRTVKAAVDAGFRHALPSILDANLCTLISALFLFQFGSGPVRGFAVTLTIGIAGTLFSGLIVSRYFFDCLLARRARIETLSI